VASLDHLLAKMVELGGSDLHLKVGSPPVVRINGTLHPLDQSPLNGQDTESFAQAIMPVRAVSAFRENQEADFAYGKTNLGRFRVNVYRQRGSVSLVLRSVFPASKNFEELGLPRVLRKLIMERRGLLLVTGPTGSGKTTTMAAMIDAINSSRRCNIITVEDPIEVLHPDKLSIVSQREIGVDTHDFHQALMRVLRQDPDVILIGEMRNLETVEVALRAAETGHLVLSSLHTIDATESINRILDFFPPYQHRGVRGMLGGSLKAIVSQRLLQRADGTGRLPAVEVMTMTGRVLERIVDEGKTHTLNEVIKDGEFYGMQTFDQAIAQMYRDGSISYDEALAQASSPHDLKLMLSQMEALRPTG